MKKHSSVPAAALVAALLFVVGPLFAQSAPVAPTGAYSGPRFPGGPDSLQALVGRSIGRAAPGVSGLLTVKFELKDGRQPHQFELVMPPAPLDPALLSAALSALTYLQDHMPEWQPAPAVADGKRSDEKQPPIRLALRFGTPTPAPAYYYSETEPVFPDLSGLVKSPRRNAYVREMKGSGDAQTLKKLVRFTQYEVFYPAAAQRNSEQGTVVVYFEVSETGTIENQQIVGTAGQALDAEVLRIVNKLPAALRPGQVNGRPARVYYALPCTFKIM